MKRVLIAFFFLFSFSSYFPISTQAEEIKSTCISCTDPPRNEPVRRQSVVDYEAERREREAVAERERKIKETKDKRKIEIEADRKRAKEDFENDRDESFKTLKGVSGDDENELKGLDSPNEVSELKGIGGHRSKVADQAHTNLRKTKGGMVKNSLESKTTGKAEDLRGGAEKVFENSEALEDSGIKIGEVWNEKNWPKYVTNDPEIVKLRKSRDARAVYNKELDAKLKENRKAIAVADSKNDSETKAKLVMQGSFIKSALLKSESEETGLKKEMNKKARKLIEAGQEATK